MNSEREGIQLLYIYNFSFTKLKVKNVGGGGELLFLLKRYPKIVINFHKTYEKLHCTEEPFRFSG